VLFISNPRDEETFLKQLGHLELLKELGVRPVYIDIMGEKHKSQIFGKEGQVLVFHECKGCFDLKRIKRQSFIKIYSRR